MNWQRQKVEWELKNWKFEIINNIEKKLLSFFIFVYLGRN